ncbi:MAG: T9SS type A sorting domain-containing protein [Candidatus Eiseniibacteriota bacterium]
MRHASKLDTALPALPATVTLVLLLAAIALPGPLPGTGPASASAQTTGVILPMVDGEAGGRVSTDLVIEDAPGITGITLEITFNAAVVEPDPDITMGPFGSSLSNIHGANVVGDTLRIAVAVSGDTTGYVGSGTLLTIEWDLLAAGLSPLQFTRTLLEDNQSPPPLPASPQNGLITVQGGQGPGGCECPPDEPRVTVSSARGRNGEQITVDIGIQHLPLPVDAFGLSLVYDPAVLAFVPGSLECPDLTSDWAFCNAVEHVPGEVVVGGFHVTAIPEGAVGAIARLTFDVVCTSCVDGDESEMTLADLDDDLAEFETCCGLFTYGEQCRSDGDVNRSGSLSPGDAQCAFKMYFNDQTVTADCDVDGDCEVAAADVNCNGTVSPGDALAIFQRWLENGDPEPCFNAGAPGFSGRPGAAGVATASRDGEAFRLDTAPLAGEGLVALPIRMRRAAGALALALEIDFAAADLEFRGLDIEPVARGWQGFEARVTGAGDLRTLTVGAFDPVGLSAMPAASGAAGDAIVIGHLRFEKRRAAAGFIDLRWTERLLAAAAVAGDGGGRVPGFVGRPHPNPTRAGIALGLDVPAGTALEVAIFDVQGRRVTTLLDGRADPGLRSVTWDRRDGAGHEVGPGIYLARLSAGAITETRKIVVID